MIGPPKAAYAPATGCSARANEELIEAECRAAERVLARRSIPSTLRAGRVGSKASSPRCAGCGTATSADEITTARLQHNVVTTSPRSIHQGTANDFSLESDEED